MNWGIIWTVLAKELRETLRDRRTLFIMIVVPALLYPGLMVMMEQLTLFGQRELEREPIRVAVSGPVPASFGVVERDTLLRLVQIQVAAERAVREARVEAVLVTPPEGWSPEETNEVRIVFDATRDRSRRARLVLEQRLDELRDSLLAARLEASGLPAAFATPVAISSSSVATPRQLGGYALGRFLPLILILMTILGAFYPAIDLAAGEKERGTLETLLTAAVPADHIVTGKFAAAALIAFTAAAVNLLSMLLTFQSGLVQFTRVVDIRFELPLQAILVVAGVLMLLAVLFAALFLGIAVRSHSFKEAQNSLTPIYVLSILPAMLPMMPGVQFTMGLALLPVGGVAFLLRELLTGNPLGQAGILALGSTIVYTMGALIFAAKAFGREDILFGSGAGSAEPRSWRERLRAFTRGGTGALSRGEALGLIAGIALLYFYAARYIQLAYGEAGILLSQLLLLALPAALFVAVKRYDARDAFALRSPPPRAYLAALLIIAGGIPIGWAIAWLQSLVLPIPTAFLEALRQLVTADDPLRLLWLVLVIAITPAVCEELVFRGGLLQGLARTGSMWAAVLASALIFGAFHLSTETIIRFLPTVWLGLLLGYVVWHTRSVYTSMLMHFTNNALIVLILSTPVLRERFADPTGQPPWLLVGLAPLVLLAGGWLLPKRRAGEDEPGELAPTSPGAPAATQPVATGRARAAGEAARAAGER